MTYLLKCGNLLIVLAPSLLRGRQRTLPPVHPPAIFYSERNCATALRCLVADNIFAAGTSSPLERTTSGARVCVCVLFILYVYFVCAFRPLKVDVVLLVYCALVIESLVPFIGGYLSCCIICFDAGCLLLLPCLL
jgi:hypothetical protein